MSTLFSDNDKFTAIEIPIVQKLQAFVKKLNTHMFHRKTTSVDPGNYEHWAEAIKYDASGKSVYDTIRIIDNFPGFSDKRCASIILSHTPDYGASDRFCGQKYNFVCNGEDDSAKIQTAYNLVSQIGVGRIFLKKGSYLLYDSINMVFPIVGNEHKKFHVVIEGEQGAALYNTITNTDPSIPNSTQHAGHGALFDIRTTWAYNEPPTLTFKNLIMDSSWIYVGNTPDVGEIYSNSKFVNFGENSLTPFKLTFEGCGFIISDEHYGMQSETGGWQTFVLNGSSRFGDVIFKDCYFKRTYDTINGLYESTARRHLGNIIYACRLRSLIIDSCIFYDRGARHEFDPFVYTTPPSTSTDSEPATDLPATQLFGG